MSAGQSILGATTGSVNPAFVLDDLLSAPFEPTILLNADGVIVATNRAASDLYGLSEEHGHSARSVATLSPVFAALEPDANPGGLPIVEGPSQRTWYVHSASTPSGGSLIILRDVTDWKQLSVTLVDLMHIVSHDLRTPLTALKSYAEMLVDAYFGEMNPNQQSALEKLTLGIYGMVSLVDNLQAADRFDPRKGLYKAERTPLDVATLAQTILEEQQLPAEIQKISLVLVADPTTPIVRADPLMLKCALANLVDNALKYSPPDTTVVVQVSPNADGVQIAVTDQGNGIAEADYERIFERSVRVEQPGQKRVRGSGLGLYLVKSVAERHGGAVWVESTLGEGSTFYLRIPVRGEAAGT